MTHEELFVIQLIVAAGQLVGLFVTLRKLRGEISKTKAEEQSALGQAVEGAGQTLSGAWERIGHLEEWKQKAQAKIDTLEEELRKWRNYAARLIRRLKEVDPTGEIPEFDTEPKIKVEAK